MLVVRYVTVCHQPHKPGQYPFQAWSLVYLPCGEDSFSQPICRLDEHRGIIQCRILFRCEPKDGILFFYMSQGSRITVYEAVIGCFLFQLRKRLRKFGTKLDFQNPSLVLRNRDPLGISKTEAFFCLFDSQLGTYSDSKINASIFHKLTDLSLP